MFSKYLKISSLFALCCLVGISFIVGCKNADAPLGHQGPFDVPPATATITNTPTFTATPGPVNVSCYVNYNGNQSGLSWNLVDPNGNTLNQTVQSTGGTVFPFTPSIYGVYSVNIPTQTSYLYSSQPLTITGAGNYSVTFTCSGQTLSTNPTSFNYSSAVGYQTPVTVSYSYSGNLDVPVSIQTGGLSSAFSVSPSYVVLNNSGALGTLTVTKNTAYFSNTTLSLYAYDLLGGTSIATSNISILRGFTIPVTITINNNLFVRSNGGTGDGTSGTVFQNTPVPTPDNSTTNPWGPSGIGGGANSASVCSINFSYDPIVASLQGVTISGSFTPGSDACDGGVGNCNVSTFSMNDNSTNASAIFFGGFYASLTTPSDPGTWNFTITGPTGASTNYQFSDNGCNGVGSCSNSTVFMNDFVISY